MKLNRRINHDMRKTLDTMLKPWKEMPDYFKPRKGWLKCIRESLGISSRQMAKFLGRTNSAVLALEKREVEGKVTLETLEVAAETLGCKLVYAVVPHGDSLEQNLSFKAKEAAERIVKKTQHHMRLEDQDVSDKESREQIEDLAYELKEKLDPKIWE